MRITAETIFGFERIETKKKNRWYNEERHKVQKMLHSAAVRTIVQNYKETRRETQKEKAENQKNLGKSRYAEGEEGFKSAAAS